MVEKFADGEFFLLCEKNLIQKILHFKKNDYHNINKVIPHTPVTGGDPAELCMRFLFS